jgi:hypothetical protein
VYTIAGETVETAPWIGRCQVVQERPDRIVLRVVPSGRPVGDGVQRVLAEVRAALGAGIEFDVVFVDELERLAGGKYRLALSLVDHGDPAGEGG